MSFFNKFPKYLTRTTKNTQIIITDFFRRVKTIENANNIGVFLLPYLVLDGETPERVSYKVYDTPLYHWVILKVNNIVNPRTEWPIENKLITTLVFEKYDFIVTVPDTTKYNEDDIVMSDDDATFVVTQVNDDTVQLRSQVGQTFLTTSSILENTTTEETGLTVTAVTDPTEGIHHYLDSTHGFIIDYSISNPNIIPITNYDYEVQLNDQKRAIKVLDPRYVGQFVRTFQNLIGQ